MPVTIGKKSDSDFHDPIGMLSDCHRRIERFLSGLLTIAEHDSHGQITEANRPQFETALRYFREAAPNHTRDEEESLFPRLLQHKNPETELISAILERLEAEHLRVNESHRIIDKLGTEWLEKGNLTSSEIKLLLENLQTLRSEYEGHIALEDEQLFPLAQRVLDPAELELIGEEMAARRGIRINAKDL